jgi:hypothetical protein
MRGEEDDPDTAPPNHVGFPQLEPLRALHASLYVSPLTAVTAVGL